MSLKQSKVAKRRWARTPQSVKSEQMSHASVSRWGKTSLKDRKKVAFKLVQARRNKQK